MLFITKECSGPYLFSSLRKKDLHWTLVATIGSVNPCLIMENGIKQSKSYSVLVLLLSFPLHFDCCKMLQTGLCVLGKWIFSATL